MRGPRRKIDRDSRAQPCDEERTNEIVADIIAAVGGVPESLVRRLIDDLRTETPSLTGNKRKNKVATRAVQRTAAAFKRALTTAPAPVHALIFAPEEFWPAFMWQGTAIEIGRCARSTQGPTGAPQVPRSVARLEQFISGLDRIRAECDQILKIAPGRHGAVRYQQERAAMASAAVMPFAGEHREMANGTVTFAGAPLTCSPTSLYCRVAALFFEAISGKDNQDLRRACATVAQAPQRRPDAQN